MLHSFCEFSAVIQLAATFNLGSIALSGQGSFAKSLADYFFNVEKYMNLEFKKIKECISTDKNSFKNMIPQTIQGRNYKEEIEHLEKRFKLLEDETNSVLVIVKNEIETNYTPKYLDSVCIVLGLYSLFELIMSVFIKIGIEDCILSFSALNVITLLIVWVCILGEIIDYACSFRKETSKFFNYFMQSRNAVLLSVVSLVLACLFPYVNQVFCPRIEYTDTIGCFHFYVGLLLPFVGFGVYWIYIQLLSRRAKGYIRKRFSSLKERFQNLHDRRNEIDTILTEFSINNIQFESNE